MSGERVLVTGAAGLVGSHLARRFVRGGFVVRALDRHPFDLAGAECLLGDVADAALVARVAADASVIVHCAAVITGAPQDVTRVNLQGTRLLLDAARLAGCRRFLHISTGVVYAFEDLAVVDESTPLRQDGPVFHMSRVHAEQAVWEASAWGLPVTVLRPWAILGAHRSGTWSALLAQQIARGEFVMRGDGSGSIPYVHVDSFVETIVTAARSAHAVGQAYNIVDGQTTGREIISRFCEWLGVDLPLPRHQVVPWRGQVSGAKAERELGHKPRVSYEEAMASTERFLVELGIVTR